MSPHATVVLPAPELVPAMTTRGITRVLGRRRGAEGRLRQVRDGALREPPRGAANTVSSSRHRVACARDQVTRGTGVASCSPVAGSQPWSGQTAIVAPARAAATASGPTSARSAASIDATFAARSRSWDAASGPPTCTTTSAVSRRAIAAIAAVAFAARSLAGSPVAPIGTTVAAPMIRAAPIAAPQAPTTTVSGPRIAGGTSPSGQTRSPAPRTASGSGAGPTSSSRWPPTRWTAWPGAAARSAGGEHCRARARSPRHPRLARPRAPRDRATRAPSRPLGAGGRAASTLHARSPSGTSMAWAAASSAPRSTRAGGVQPSSAGIATSEPGESPSPIVRTRVSSPSRARRSSAGVRASSRLVGSPSRDGSLAPSRMTRTATTRSPAGRGCPRPSGA